MANYQLLTTTMAGVPYAEIANAEIESVSVILNGWGELKWSLPVNDPQAYDELRPDYQTAREVQLWRNGVLIFWGVYVAADCDQDRVNFIAYGLLWYFSRRYFGPVVSNVLGNLLSNGDFEATPVSSGWTAIGPVAMSASTSRRRKGAQSVRLTATGVVGQECIIAQAEAVPTPARTRPLTFTVSGWHYIESVTIPHPINNAIGVGPGGSSAEGITRIEPDDPLGVWIFREHSYTVAAGAAPSLTAALYAPSAGVAYWDDVRLSYDQRTGGVEGEDWQTYFERIFSYGAGLNGGGTGGSPIWWGAPELKQSLNMTWTGSGLAAGSMRADRWWDHADEAMIWQAMQEIAARNVLDFEVTWPANGRSRTMTVYPPRKGSTKLGLAIEDGRDIVSYRYTVDGRRRSNDVRVSGRGPGTVREVGQSAGLAAFFPPQLESVISPAFEIAGQQLIDLADAEKSRLSLPVKVVTVTVAAGRFMGDPQPGGTAEAGAPLVVGDSIPVRLNNGWAREANTRRVIGMTLHPKTETLDVVFNDS